MLQPADFLKRNAALYPDRLAIVAQGTEVTYRRLDELSCRIASALRQSGIGRGDRVTCLLGNNGAFAVLFHALLKLGAVAVPLSKRLLADDVAFMVERTRAKALFFDSDKADCVREAASLCSFGGLLVQCGSDDDRFALPWNRFKCIADEVDAETLSGYASPSDESLIMFTSGTTGRPKAVVKTAEMVQMLFTIQLVEGHSYRHQPPVLYTQAPLFHMGGLCAMLKICAMEGTLVLESHFDPELIYHLMETYRVDQLYMIPPALFTRLYEHPARQGRTYPQVTEVQCAGGRTRDCDREAIFSLFPAAHLRTSFGSSECAMATVDYYTKSEYEEHPDRTLSVGRPCAFVTIKIVDEQGHIVPDGEPGEALLKSPTLFSCYLDQPLETANAFDGEGFFHTHDILYRAPEGFYVFVDRINDMIKTGGENVYAVEVERALQKMDGIVDCAVVGLEDNLYGESIAAAIVLDEDAAGSFTPDGLIEHCRSHLAGFKKPRYLAIVDELPRNALGKVQKNVIRQQRDQFRQIAS